MTDRIYSIPYQSVTYGGVTYRSILDLRWHILLESLHIFHAYEPKRFYFSEFYGTDCHAYTPDYALIGCPYDYLEIKPTNPTLNEYAKIRALSQRGYKCALFAGRCAPDVHVYLFENGCRKYIARSSIFLQQCFKWGLTYGQGESIVALKMVLGKHRNWIQAFRKANERIFNGVEMERQGDNK